MANKPKFLKNLLTTTSALVALTAASSSAFAATRTTTGNAALNTGAVSDNGLVGWANADVLVIGGAHAVTIGNGPAAIQAINVNAAGGSIIDGQGSAIGSIVGTALANTIAYNVNGAVALTLTGTASGDGVGAAASNVANTYTGLGNILLSNAAAELKITLAGGVKSITLAGTIDGSGAGKGIITVDAGNTLILTNKVGHTGAIDKIDIAGNLVAKHNVKIDGGNNGAASKIDLAANSTLTFDSTTNAIVVSGGNGDGGITGANGVGTLTFTGANGTTLDVKVGNAANTSVLKTNINNTVVTLGANSTVIKSQEITFAGANSKLVLGAGVTTISVLGANGVSTADANGIINVNGANAQIIATQKVGGAAAANQLKEIKFSTDTSLSLITNGSGAVVAAGTLGVQGVTTTAGNNTGTLVLGLGATQNIINDIGATGARLKVLTLHSNDGNDNALTTVNLAAGKGIYAQTVNLAGVQKQNVLELEEGTLVDATDIVGNANASEGNIVIKGTSHATGNIGNAQSINTLTFAAGSATKTFTVDGTKVNANGAIGFGANNATLELSNAGATEVRAVGNITATNVGKITSAVTAGNALKFTGGNIGAVGNFLAAIEAKAGGIVEFNGGNVFVTSVDISGTPTGTVKLNKAGGNFIFNLAHTPGQGIIEVNDDATFGDANTASVLSADNANAIDSIRMLNGNKTLTFANAINIFASNANGGIQTATANNGNLVFSKGTNVVGTTIGTAAAKLATLKLANAAGVSVELQGASFFNGAVTLQGADNKFRVGAALTADSIDGNGGNEGTLIFLPGATKFTGNIGAGNKVSAVQIEGGDLEITGTIASNTGIAFTKDVASTLKLSNVGDVLNGQAVTSVSTTRGHNIILANTADIVINQAIGSNNNALGFLTFSTDKKVTLTNNNFFAGIQTTAPNQTEVELAVAKDDGIVYGLGDATNVLKTVSFTNNATVTGDTFSKNITVADGKTGNFNGNVTSSVGLVLGAVNGNGANAVFGDGNSSFAKITTATAAKSDVTFKGATRITQTIGEGNALNNITFASADAAKVEVLGANIAATTITHGKGTLLIGTTNAIPASNTAEAILAAGVAGANVTVDGIFTGTDSSIVLPTSTLTFKGVGSKLVTSANVTTQYDGTKGGNIVVDGANNTLDLTTNLTSKLNLTLLDTSDTIPDANGRSFTVLGQTNGGALTVDFNKINFTAPGNTYVKWAATVDGKNIKLTQTNNVRAGATADFTKLGATQRELDMLGVITDPGVSGDAFALQGLLKALKDEDTTGAKGIELVDRLDPLQTATTAISNDLQTAVDGISNRISSVAAPMALELTSNDNAISGVSAGEGDNAKYGAWGNPFYSQSTQKSRKGIAGYKAKAFGATVGFDTMANDTMTVGAAVTAMKTDVKHKNAKTGDKTKADTFMFSIYGLQQVTDNWFVQGVASFGTSKIKNTEKRVVVGGYQSASAKYDSMNYGGEVLAGYNYKVNETMILTPMFGVNYNRFNDTGYKETGTVNQNLFVSKKSFDKFEAVLGGRAAMSTEMNGVTVTPEVHAFVRHDLRGKGARLDARLNGALNAFPPKSTKPNRTMFNVGLGVNARNGMMQYGIGYDAHIANKYVGHLGSIKVRVNF